MLKVGRSRIAAMSLVLVICLLVLFAIADVPTLNSGSSVSSTTSSNSYLQTLPSVNASGWSQLRGTNYFWYNLTGEGNSAPLPSVSFPLIKEDGFNLVRVQFFWANYLQNESQYLLALQNVARTAQETGLYVDFVMMDYGVGPQFGGFGFPYVVTQNYSSEEAFWTAWYANAVKVNGTSGWDLQLQVWTSVIGAVGNYSSVIGYEIMNEPPVWNSQQLVQLSTLQTYMASHIRRMTAQWILFARPYLQSDLSSTGQPTLQQMIESAPKGVNNLVFAPHRYGFYSAPSTDGDFLNYSKVSQLLKVPVFVGEWSIVNLPDRTWNQNETNFLTGYIGDMHEYGFAWAYEGWQENVLYNTSDPDEWQYQLSPKGTQWDLDVGLSEAIAYYYGETPVTLTSAVGDAARSLSSPLVSKMQTESGEFPNKSQLTLVPSSFRLCYPGYRFVCHG
jgi:hypothetical protein